MCVSVLVCVCVNVLVCVCCKAQNTEELQELGIWWAHRIRGCVAACAEHTAS